MEFTRRHNPEEQRRYFYLPFNKQYSSGVLSVVAKTIDLCSRTYAVFATEYFLTRIPPDYVHMTPQRWVPFVWRSGPPPFVSMSF
jgi:hypothetical protein